MLFFEPDCEHCIRELKEIRSDTLLYKQAEIFLVSLSDKRETEYLANQLYLSDLKYLHVVLLEDKSKASLPQQFMLPTLLFFNEKKKLTKIIEGETNVASILSYLKR